MGSQGGGTMGTPWVGSPKPSGPQGTPGLMGHQGPHGGAQGIPGGLMGPQGLMRPQGLMDTLGKLPQEQGLSGTPGPLPQGSQGTPPKKKRKKNLFLNLLCIYIILFFIN